MPRLTNPAPHLPDPHSIPPRGLALRGLPSHRAGSPCLHHVPSSFLLHGILGSSEGVLERGRGEWCGGGQPLRFPPPHQFTVRAAPVAHLLGEADKVGVAAVV